MGFFGQGYASRMSDGQVQVKKLKASALFGRVPSLFCCDHGAQFEMKFPPNLVSG